jgi:toxin ParE1/3/4
MQVIFTPRAMRQVEELHSYILAKAGDRIADGYVDRIVRYCEGLDTFPMRGTRRDDILPGLRTIGFERRVTIAFMITPDAVLIEGIFYGGQDFEGRLAKP